MQYSNVQKGIFLSRPNRFIARVLIDGQEKTVHVKNTGRCAELLVPGAEVYLAPSENPARETKYDLIAVRKERTGLPSLLINMDSQAPNEAVAEWLPTSGLYPPDAVFRREAFCGASRFDFRMDWSGHTAWLEVKGVTLEEDGIVCFPDAPTERGVRHVRELRDLALRGEHASVLFVIQMSGTRAFVPNEITHAAFGDALREAAAAGVRILARECHVTPSSMTITDPVPILNVYE